MTQQRLTGVTTCLWNLEAAGENGMIREILTEKLDDLKTYIYAINGTYIHIYVDNTCINILYIEDRL